MTRIKWSIEKIICELKRIIEDIGEFPSYNKIKNIYGSKLARAITTYGGLNKFRVLLGFDFVRKPNGYWSEENIIKELKNIIIEIGHFPTKNELVLMGKKYLSSVISYHGGLEKFRILMGYELIQKSNGYWSDEVIIKKLKLIIKKLGHFPTENELSKINGYALSDAINKNGGFPKFRKILGYGLLQKPNGYWTFENTLKELKLVVEKTGRFPTANDLSIMNKGYLIGSIYKNGGFNNFRRLLEFDLIKKPIGYWTDETIAQELKKIENEINHFPTQNELIDIDRYDLHTAISNNGGINKFRLLLGYTVSMYDEYITKLRSYTTKRGKKTEAFLKQILSDYISLHNSPSPLQLNVKLSPGHIIEFVCNTGKTIGIDVTNTENGSYITKKWRKKDYHKYLDELWVVVFSDSFTDDNYINWNNKSPENVKVFSIYGFLEELDYSLTQDMKSKIDKYCSCTFHTKEEFEKERLLNQLYNIKKIKEN